MCLDLEPPRTQYLPGNGKGAGGNYLLSQLMKVEALKEGYAEAIALDVNGYLAEGTGENLFVVRDNVLYTPSLSSSLQPGVTRHSIIEIARESGYDVREMNLPRELLYIADELFFTGTAAEVTPIRSVDKLPVADGKPGPVTMDLQKKYFDIVHRGIDSRHWLQFGACRRGPRRHPCSASAWKPPEESEPWI